MPIPVEAIDQFVDDEGETVRHQIGMRCFCHGADGQPDPNCTLHENGGWYYAEEQIITGLVTDISQRRELMETGAFMPGDCVFSPKSTDLVSEGDKIIFTWPLPYGQGDVLVRGTGASDTLYYEGVKGIYCIDQVKQYYRQDVDYKLDGKNIVWDWTGKTGIKPASGTKYVIKYTAYIEWIAFVPPVTRTSSGEDIGAKVMLRKKHLMEQV
ncbi:DUF4815 domain-containing protein [Oryzomonas rubra]|nr:DUF4815 domain-containing protein [Oryzomonas rubra]